MDPLAKDVAELNQLDKFLRLSLHIEGLRESAIKDLRSADAGKVMEVSGQVQAYDGLLELLQWQSVRSRAYNLAKQ
jgi:hypothetical protein